MNKINKNLYYVYLHIDPRTSQVVYVGKGNGSRAWKFSGRNKLHSEWIKELKILQMSPIVKIAHTFNNEKDALIREKIMIPFLVSVGQAILNLNRGGGGHPGGSSHPSYGKQKSLEVRAKISKSLTGRLRPDLSECTKLRMIGNTIKNGTKSDSETKEKISKSLIGNSNRSKKIICLNNGKTYSSIKEAWTELNLTEESVYKVLNGKWLHTKGYKFKRI